MLVVYLYTARIICIFFPLHLCASRNIMLSALRILYKTKHDKIVYQRQVKLNELYGII